MYGSSVRARAMVRVRIRITVRVRFRVRVRVRLVLVRLQQLHVGRDDLAAHVVEHLGRREEVVVDGGGDRGEEADRSGHEQVLGR